MITIAHRGGAGLWPENSWEAFEGAEQLGVDMVECDVQVSRDGVVMMSHDFVADRTALHLIQQGVPLLSEVLLRRTKPLLIDIKSPMAANGIVRLLTKKHPTGREGLWFGSFDWRCVVPVLRAYPDLRGGVFCIDTAPSLTDPWLQSMHFIAVHHRVLSASLMAHLKTRVPRVFAWVVNDPDDIHAMVDQGVDGIISDYPDRVLAAVKGAST